MNSIFMWKDLIKHFVLRTLVCLNGGPDQKYLSNVVQTVKWLNVKTIKYNRNVRLSTGKKSDSGRLSMLHPLDVWSKLFCLAEVKVWKQQLQFRNVKVNRHDFLLSGGFDQRGAADSYIISLVAGAKPSVTPLRYANLALQMPIH